MSGMQITPPPDVIDHLAGIAPGSALSAIRDGRAQARENAQNSFLALFATTETQEMGTEERFAVAAFICALHGDGRARGFYAAPLPAPLASAVAAAAERGAGQGPYGEYPSAALAGENQPGPVLTLDPPARAALGARLAAALEHTHMLILHPRDAAAGDLQRLLDAGWSSTGIVTLSQLVAFLSFQLRVVAGLRALAAAPNGG
jgi:CMD domain protein